MDDFGIPEKLPRFEAETTNAQRAPQILPNGNEVSNEKNLGWLGYIEDYTTQLNRDYNKPL